jgi:hypothetical protein
MARNVVHTPINQVALVHILDCEPVPDPSNVA